MTEVTEALVEAAFRGEPDAAAQLVTIYSDALDEPIAVTDWPGGLRSNGVDHVHYPFQLKWAGASQDNPFGQGRLTIANVDQRIEEACDAAQDPPRIDLAVVRVAEPDVLERALMDARVSATEGDETKATAVIQPRSFTEEPACAVSYTPATAPGQF
ncbi:MAG TPA: hypothetical protein DGP25_07075 [Brevundimonas sp.]|uniref:Uncharacterized protein n=1 Tax=Brevundimonas vancanneytii TaxID=1325724 RepID=A0A4P1JU41_9CAUL|nr:Uncharacterised protein [Brevundimonas vancanneytii]HCW49755.1 hypothetical protein [Brevundimonas sp.]